MLKNLNIDFFKEIFIYEIERYCVCHCGRTTSPCPLHSEGAGAVHCEVAPPCDEQPGTAEGGVAHDDGLGGEGDPSPGAEVNRGHQAGEATHQVDNSTASIIHRAELLQPTVGRPVWILHKRPHHFYIQCT